MYPLELELQVVSHTSRVLGAELGSAGKVANSVCCFLSLVVKFLRLYLLLALLICWSLLFTAFSYALPSSAYFSGSFFVCF